MALSIQEKKKMLTKLKRLLTTVSKISNTLVGEENASSKNENYLYAIRQEADILILVLDNVEYK